jgi:acetyl-CoA acetyltransferase
MVNEALELCFDRAGMTPDQVESVVMSNNGHYWDGQPAVAAQSWLYGHEFGHVQIFNVENACVGGGTAMHLASMLLELQRGPVLVIGVERMYVSRDVLDELEIPHPVRDMLLRQMEGGINRDLREELRAKYANEFGSIFMGLNGSWAQSQVEIRGHTPEQAAIATSKARHNAMLSGNARFMSELSVDDVLDSPMVADPIRLSMCSPFSDGAGAVLLTADAPSDRPTLVASEYVSGDGTGEAHDRMEVMSGKIWAELGLDPHDVDVVEVHDASSFEELWALEACGFYDVGGAGTATEAGETSLGGRQPVNPGGGLIGRGHPPSATGVLQIVELYEQLTGLGGERQVPGATIAFAENQGGLSGYADAAGLAMHVLRI